MSNMMALAYRLFRILQYVRLTKRPGLLRVLSRHPRLNLTLLEQSGPQEIRIKGTNVTVNRPDREFFLQGLDCVEKLLKQAGAKFEETQEGVLLRVQGVVLRLENWEELFIAAEVFAEGIYNIQVGRPFVLIDVGMNVGTTSLYFSNRPACEAVYGFEPFPKTLAKGRVNLSLNPSLAPKITVTPEGLAATASTAELDYVDEFRGSVGIHGLASYVDRSRLAGKLEKVRVKFASCVEAVSGIAEAHPGTSLICKVDCEGAEYEILQALAASGVLSRICCFMIEWHVKGAADLERLLAQNGFSFLSLSPNAPTHSMLYAWRESPPNPYGL